MCEHVSSSGDFAEGVNWVNHANGGERADAAATLAKQARQFGEAGAPPLTLAWHAVTEKRPYSRLQIGSCSASATADGANNSHGRARAGRSSGFFLSLRKPLAGSALAEPFKASTADRRGGGECGP